MQIFLGIDVGTVSLKIALLFEGPWRDMLDPSSQIKDLFYQPKHSHHSNPPLSDSLLVTKYYPLKGDPLKSCHQLLSSVLTKIPHMQIAGMRVCGSGANLIADRLGIKNENEFRAIASAAGMLYPGFATVFEMGGQSSKYLALVRDLENDRTSIADYEKSGDCAAGTGAFMDQQASRLKYPILTGHSRGQ